MLTSPQPNSTDRSAGFTLVEVLAALAVVGLIASAVMLASPGADTRLHAGVERMAARLKLAGDESVLVNRPVALVAAPEGYHFELRDEDGWRRMDAASSLGFQPWPGDSAPSIEVPADAEREGEGRRLAEFDPLGGASAMRLVFGSNGPAWRIAIDEAGVIHVDHAS